MRHAIGIDQKLEFDLTGTMRGSAQPKWFRCRFCVLRWRRIAHRFRDEFGARRLKKPGTTCGLLLSRATGLSCRALRGLRTGVASYVSVYGNMTVRWQSAK